jgi:hypothetical protein
MSRFTTVRLPAVTTTETRKGRTMTVSTVETVVIERTHRLDTWHVDANGALHIVNWNGTMPGQFDVAVNESWTGGDEGAARRHRLGTCSCDTTPCGA